MSRLGNLGHRLHRGEIAYDFVGKRKLWYSVSILITVAAILGLVFNGLKLGIEFSGGAVFTTPKTPMSVSQVQDRIDGDTGDHQALVQKLGTGSVRIQISDITLDEAKKIQGDIAQDLDIKAADIDPQIIGPSWGDEISKKAFEGLVIFMVLVTIYMAIAFEWRKAVAALIALLHDLTITIGVYAIVGFEVTPGTVIGLLTVLGYSLYDTVVVFDGLKESTKDITKQNRYTYSELANRSLNQTLVRSINTTVVALLPVSRPAVRRWRSARRGHAQRHRAVAVRRPHRRCVLLDLHRDPAGRGPQGARPGDQGPAQAGARQARRRRPPCRAGRGRPAGLHRCG